MNIVVRRAKPEELRTIQELNRLLFESDSPRDPHLNLNWPYEDGEDYFRKRINDNNHLCLVAEVDGKIVGYLAGAIREVESWRPIKRTELENMLVKEDFRDKGVGAKLVQEFFKWSREQGAERVLVVVYATNERATKFYEKMGFVRDSINLEANLTTRT